MRQQKGKGKMIVEQSGDVAVAALEAVVASSAIFPPLQSVAGSALYIAKLVRNFRSNKEEWTEFSKYVDEIVADVIGKLPKDKSLREDIKESIKKLSSTLSTIAKEIEQVQQKSTSLRFFLFATRPDQISGMKQRLDEAIKLLQLKIALTTHMNVATIAAAQKEITLLEQHNQAVTGNLVERCMEIIQSTITFTALSYTPNAGWDDTQTCLDGTRQAEIDKVMAWVQEKDLTGAQQIYFLADVVGSGKTALAHSVAQRCVDCKLLASSFFFDRKAGRTSPRDFVLNLARDLGSKFPEVAGYISLALREDPNLALSHPVSYVFKKLILEPVTQSSVAGPIVVVIDALHDAETPEVETILRTQIPQFSGQFRLFATSRPERSVLRTLGPDITTHDLDIHGPANRADMAIYATHRLEEIASEHALGNWPNRQLITTLLDRAEGLFIWLATVCDYLFYCVSPDAVLEELLLETMRESQLPPEKKMDALYSTIMASCHWDDVHFVRGYQQVMGVMVVQKMSFTVDGLQRLHGTTPRVKPIVDQLASLITGLTGLNRPVQILHGSFREYVTQRAPGQHRILAEKHNTRLALICLRILNSTFSNYITGCGYLLSKRGSEVPDVDVGHFTEEQWYAVEFWLAHNTHGEDLDSSMDVKQELLKFVGLHLQSWIEVIASKSKYQSLTPLRKRLQGDLGPHMGNFSLGSLLRRLLRRLMGDESRLGAALLVMDDLKDMGEASYDSESDGESELELERVSDSSDDMHDTAASNRLLE
ncbi:hypothetical protein K438DRAFT_1818360 [Mycena galopus ATCC 62051]|nr:hypothetical protein K438DRAFT_1818360 [Mycena galopus ATCC 62051]